MSCEQCLSPLDCTAVCQATVTPVASQSLVYRLRKRAEIRRQIPGRKSVDEGKEDRIANLLDEAAKEIVRLNEILKDVTKYSVGRDNHQP
jgi:hypothetical protein